MTSLEAPGVHTCAGCFLVSEDPRGDILGLTTLTGLSTSQLISLVVGISALIVLIIRRRRAQAVDKTDGLVANGARA